MINFFKRLRNLWRLSNLEVNLVGQEAILARPIVKRPKTVGEKIDEELGGRRMATIVEDELPVIFEDQNND